MPSDPFSDEQRGDLAASLDDLIGTEAEEQVIIQGLGGGTMDIAHLDDEFAVYLEWVGDLRVQALPLPPDATVHDDSDENATIGLGPLDVPGVIGLLESWAPLIFGDAPLEWSAGQ